jgi:PTH2 family peptidyl-tRNA hydrolase
LTVRHKKWLEGNFAKITVSVNSEQELLDIAEKAKTAGVECHLVRDSGLTEFHGVPTLTCLALGPDDAVKIDAITGHLSLR